CLICGARRFVAGFVIVMLVMAAISMIVSHWSLGESQFTGLGVIYILVKFGPMLAMMVFVQASLNASRFLRSLEGIRIPPSWVISLGACLRFLPSVVAECRQIRYAMRIRGIGPRPRRLLRHPFETISYAMVPLLVRSLFIGEELARAAVARGIEAPGVKSSLYHVGLRPGDVLMLVGWTLSVAAMLIGDHLAYTGFSGDMP
ncbi:MAG: energy-coupling factor transporter transmembrane component T, partial [Desulfarculaceae bacterium]